MEIKDSGNRREFETGAVRDIAEGKGRCDLLPLDCVAEYFRMLSNPVRGKDSVCAEACAIIFETLDDVTFGRDNEPSIVDKLLRAIRTFIRITYDSKDGNAFMELAKHYEEGAKKYAERNWQKGIPAHCYIDSCVRHLLKWYDGWNDEPHDRAVLWNLLGLMWTLEHKPECNDLPCKKDGENNDRDSQS